MAELKFALRLSSCPLLHAVEGLDRGHRRRFLFEALRHGLGLLHRAQDVQPEKLLDVVIRPAPAKQLRRQLRVGRDVLETDRRLLDAIEVGSEPDVIDAGRLSNVVDVVGDECDCRL
jgi:hypothetical protein